MLKVFLIGWVVLIGAIAINLTAPLLGLATYYKLFYEGFSGLWIDDYVFLFVVYPSILGILAHLASKYINSWLLIKKMKSRK